MYRFGIQLLSYNKPKYLKRTLDSLTGIMDNDKLCIVEQSDVAALKNECLNICKQYENLRIINLNVNRGQRGATNVIYKSGFFDDCEFVMLTDHDNVFYEPLNIYCDKLNSDDSVWVATGLNSPEHDFERKDGMWLRKSTARAGHMVLRQKDFISLCPMDEDIGSKNPDWGCAWFAGLDWTITHWHKNSPGHKRSEIIAVYSGGVEHIGRESTWQGNYDDEYDLPTLIWFRDASTYSIVNHFKPRHTYLNYKYWCENLSSTGLKTLNDGNHNPPPGVSDEPLVKNVTVVNNDDNVDDIYVVRKLVKDIMNIDLDPILENSFISPLKKLEPSNNPDICDVELNGSPIIAFNYLWPEYGIQFLEKSIKSVLPYVKKYILYLNKYSYIGTECNPNNISAVNNIIKNLNDQKIEIIFNDNPNHSEVVKRDNIGYYIRETLFQVKNECDYIWYVSTDEIYDDHVAKDILLSATNRDFKNCIVIQPLCYIDNPHWTVNPPEEFNRVSIIPTTNGIDLNNKNFVTDLAFHHCSFVLTRNEVESKFKNWGHRENVKHENKGEIFLNKFNYAKTNKFVKDMHPVQPSLFKTMAFVDNVIQKEMFMEWIYYLIMNSPLETCPKKHILSKFSQNSQFQYDDISRKFITFVLTNAIPRNGKFLEIGSDYGWTSILANIVSDVQFFGIESDSTKYIKSFENFIQHNVPINIVNGDVKQIVPKFSNDFFDSIFFNIPTNPKLLRQSIIETWPKVKDFGIIFGTYDSTNPDMLSTIQSLVNRAVDVNCPWGIELFRTYELYHDILGNMFSYKNIPYDVNYKFWFARVRKN